MEGDLTTQQFQAVLRLCDMLGIEDFTIGVLMLKQTNWNLERALGLEQISKIPKPAAVSIPIETIQNPPAYQPEYQDVNYINYGQMEDEPINYQTNENNDQANQYEYEYEYYQKQFDKIEKLEKQKKMFNEGFESIPLVKTKSEINDNLEDKLKMDREISQKFNSHRFEYQSTLLDKSTQLCERILNSKTEQLRRCYQSIQKSENNRKFLSYLHKKYQSKINFTFGTFLLNLARSYLDKKHLLVYIHKSQFENNKSIKMLLGQNEISSFINKNCVSYGMFDSADDYEILHNYVQMKDLPAFVLFKLDKKQLKQKLIAVYPVLNSDSQNFLEWLASHIGVILKKKQKKPQNSGVVKSPENFEISNIIQEQNLEYEQMAKLYELKRNQSKIRKQSIEAHEVEIEKMKYCFKQEPDFQPGSTIQIRFRLPMSGYSLMRTFKLEEKVMRMFEYINCFGRDQFQQKLAKFDLTQTFPKLSLGDKKQMLISEVFPDSQRENIIVKQL